MNSLIHRPVARRLARSFVCRSCRHHLARRSLSSTTTAAATPPPPASGFAPLSSRRLLSISGPDAAKYLQGVITRSVAGADALPRTNGFYTAFLSAQGRVLHDVFVYPDTLVAGHDKGSDELKQHFLIEVDAAEAERLHKHIKRYKLRAKFDVRLLDREEAGVWHVWYDARTALQGDLGRVSYSNGIYMPDARAPGMGSRVIQLGSAPPEVLANELPVCNEDAYRIRRYLAGVPEGQDELIYDKALPQESNMDVMGGIDFHKGCYVGQELTIRTRHRGVVRKRVLPCEIYDEARAAPTALQYRGAAGEEEAGGPEAVLAESIPRDASIGRVGKKGRSAGKWLRGVGNVGLALCRLEIMTDVVLPGETTVAAPFDSAAEFVLEWGGEDGAGGAGKVKVKAFVPAWLRGGLEEQSVHKQG